MRYSFHGKVRATGQQVDGYVEAATASEAIDRLADQGIIGVYTVRPEPRAPQNSVLVSGTREFADAEARAALPPEPPTRYAAPALPAPLVQAPAPQIVYVPLPTPVAAAAPAAAPAAGESAIASLVDKVTLLLGQVEKLLARPAQVIYASGGGGGGGTARGSGKKASKNLSDSQNSTLKDIFQTNLTLRRSLEALATGGPAPVVAPAPATLPSSIVPAVEAAAELIAAASAESPAPEPTPDFAPVVLASADEDSVTPSAAEPTPTAGLEPMTFQPEATEPEVAEIAAAEPETADEPEFVGEVTAVRERPMQREMPAKVMREMPSVRDRKAAQPAA